MSIHLGEIFDPIRVEKLDESITSSVKDKFPLDISKITGTFEFEGNHLELYHNVIDRLTFYIGGNKDLNLDFYSENFIKNICNVIYKKSVPFLMTDYFLDDLQRLAVKHMIHLMQTFDLEEFERIRDDIYEKLKILSLERSDFESLKIFYAPLSISKFINKFKYEFDFEILERPELFSIFNSSRNEFYTGKISCNGLKEKYFGTKFTNDIVLMAMILNHDIEDGEMKKCFGISEFSSKFTDLLPNNKFKQEIKPLEIGDIKIQSIGLFSISMVKLYLEKGIFLNFHECSYLIVYFLFQRMDKQNLLNDSLILEKLFNLNSNSSIDQFIQKLEFNRHIYPHIYKKILKLFKQEDQDKENFP